MTAFSIKCGACGKHRQFREIQFIENEKEGTSFLCIYCQLTLDKIEEEFRAEGMDTERAARIGKVYLGKEKGRRFWWRRKKGK